jgi:hypothetical protein
MKMHSESHLEGHPRGRKKSIRVLSGGVVVLGISSLGASINFLILNPEVSVFNLQNRL